MSAKESHVYSSARPDGSYLLDVLPASLVAALGMSLAFVPLLGTAIGAASPAETGVAAGLVSTSYQIGSALGVAVRTAGAGSITGNGTSRVALTNGYSAAFAGAALIAAAGAIIVPATMRQPGTLAPEPQKAAAAQSHQSSGAPTGSSLPATTL